MKQRLNGSPWLRLTSTLHTTPCIAFPCIPYPITTPCIAFPCTPYPITAPCIAFPCIPYPMTTPCIAFPCTPYPITLSLDPSGQSVLILSHTHNQPGRCVGSWTQQRCMRATSACRGLWMHTASGSWTHACLHYTEMSKSETKH